MNWLQDIVPNHMAFHPGNAWLMDVLKNGRKSAYASFFDIEWDSPVYEGRLMVPFLGQPFDEAIAQKQVQLIGKNDQLYFTYFDQQYPVKIDSPEKYTPAYIKKVNSNPQALKELAAAQAYQLCHWQETDRQINYRRFFTVNGLICLNMQHKEVFIQYHQFIKQLLEEGIFQGLRVDHIDGLYDPEAYLNRLRRLAGMEIYITVEKILEIGEVFPPCWPVQGNTGYDFLAIVNNLFTRSASAQIFTRNYQKLIADKTTVEEGILQKKAFILKQHMAGELENLYQLFKSLNLVLPDELNAISKQLKEAIAQMLIYCPVYRFYGNSMPLPAQETAAVKSLMDTVREAHPYLDTALQLLGNVFLERTQKGDQDYNKRALRFYQRCMQFTGPLMAKGVEDTLMYTYNRFIGHNEVGDSPAAFGLAADDFHRQMMDRRREWPLGVNATSTHDTKRGEDVRARLNVLTDMPDEWFNKVQEWQRLNAGLKAKDGPDNNDEYFIYQSLLGAYPMPQSGEDDFNQRMQEYLIKALREGKRNSDWAQPNEPYEEAVKQFIDALLKKESRFQKSFFEFHQRVADHGIINSLAQVLLKFTCPGVPDLYQGCELWDLSLVDPDNRRPVNYQLRQEYLQAKQDENLWLHLWQSRYNGQIKLYLTQQLLALRAGNANVFTGGYYIPLSTTGKYKNNILAFARQLGANWYVTIIPLHLAAIGASGGDTLAFNWEDTAIVLPDAAPRSWENLLTNVKGYAASSLSAGALFKGLPLALLQLKHPAERGAGLLMHITSLPSAYGIGDIGPEAYRFVDFLFNSGQRYWQMLPVSPVDKSANYSPYSSGSGMAGNVLLISPELLHKEGWLTDSELNSAYLPATNCVDYDKVVAVKTSLFDKAYRRFIKSGGHQEEFERYKSTEAYWLHDFALYQVFKQVNRNKPWYEWAGAIKNREGSALKKASEQYAAAIDKEKWLQYIFHTQWQALKAYGAKKGIALFGDMPFYISYDSVDVWSYPEFFKLDKQGGITGVAGVPPDYFSAEGQLWGMPVYNWKILKQHNYSWWLQRIRKNLEYLDLIRLDHFRAFAAYWEVPGGEQTAVNGKWIPGPGADFFHLIKKELGSLPFVAEDLGDIDDAVYQLRDAFGLPGMRVLQFAFGGDMPQSGHIPHQYMANSFAYTGTHDNNTLKGWYMQDIDADSRKAISQYAGQKITEKNICDVLIRLCYASVAKAAIIPVQDVLELDGSARMNLPASSAKNNWTWRVTDAQLNQKPGKQLRRLTLLYNR